MAMHYHIEIRPKTLYFKKPAGTSRGTYTERKSWYIYLTAEEIPGRQGIGECAPLPKLSCDDVLDMKKFWPRLAKTHPHRQNRRGRTARLSIYPVRSGDCFPPL